MNKYFLALFFGIALSFILVSGCELQLPLSINEREDISGRENALTPRFESMKILGASEKNGGLAFDLNLQIKKGTGRVFFFSEDISNADTIISMELGKEIACREFNIVCNNNNFFFNINSENIKTKGPSAGAASAMLTAALINQSQINDSVSITGTILPGGIIGPVGGVKEKIDGAQNQNIQKVLIPYGSSLDEDSKVDLVEYGSTQGVSVIEVKNIFEAYPHLTGNRVNFNLAEFAPNSEFERNMESFANNLCQNAKKLTEETIQNNLNSSERQFLIQTENLISSGEEYYNNSNYYSSATTCFQASINARTLKLLSTTIIESEILENLNSLEVEINDFERNISSYSTINDFQVFSIVKDRIRDSLEKIEDSRESLKSRDLNTAIQNYAYAFERFETSKGWNSLFGLGGTPFNIRQDILENVCIRSLDFVERKKAYLDSLTENKLPDLINEQYFNSRSKAIEYLSEEENELCLFQVSKLNAATNEISTRLNIPEEDLSFAVSEKIKSVKRAISMQQERGNFPILGYSYLEFAEQLQGEDPLRALNYIEQAIIYSDLNVYFFNEDLLSEEMDKDSEKTQFYILIGIVSGFVIVMLSMILAIVAFMRKKKKHKRKRIKRK